MGRIYAVSTGFRAVSAAQDLIELQAGSGKPFVVHSVTISCTSDYDDTTGVQAAVKRAASGYTPGSGGGGAASLAVGIYTSSDAADSFGAEVRNNTTQATGTLATLYEEGMAPAAGFQFVPTPELRPLVQGGEALLVTVSAPADEITMSCVAIVEEL